MKKLILILSILIFIGFYGTCQEIDTVIVKKIYDGFVETDTFELYNPSFSPNVLVGTDILWTKETNQASWIGLNLENVFFSECSIDTNEEPPFFGGNKINSIDKNDSILIIDTKVVGNCCHDFLCSIEILGDTLNLQHIGYGTYCSCTCCFGITFL